MPMLLDLRPYIVKIHHSYQTAWIIMITSFSQLDIVNERWKQKHRKALVDCIDASRILNIMGMNCKRVKCIL